MSLSLSLDQSMLFSDHLHVDTFTNQITNGYMVVQRATLMFEKQYCILKNGVRYLEIISILGIGM